MKEAASLLLVLCVGCGAAPGAEEEESAVTRDALSNKDFDVEFATCAEFAGIGLVPSANAQPFVPAGYALVEIGTQAMVVVRVAKCAGAVVDGKSVGETITSQVGVTLQGPDESADINNYTVFYATNQARLHARFRAAGVGADNSNDLALSLDGGVLLASSASPHSSSYQVSGAAQAPAASPVQFVASWWSEGVHGAVQSRTVFPDIAFFTGATTTLSAPSGSALASLIGGTTLTFPILDSYNTFPTAHLEARIAE